MRSQKRAGDMDIQHVKHTERINMHRVSSMNSMYSKSYGHIKMKVKTDIMGQVSY